MKKHLILFFSLFIVGLSSCHKSDVTADQAAIDDAKIQAYIKANNITVTKDPLGYYYKIVTPGDQTSKPALFSTVQLTYTNSYLNGTQFDHVDVVSYKLSKLFNAGGFMTLGLQSGIQKIGTGGRIILIIPSGLGYGNSTQFTVPPNSILFYTVDLIGFY